MRLPIYRKLDEKFRLLGLSMLELAFLGGAFVFLTQILIFWSYGLLFSLMVVSASYLALIYLHKRFESHFALKWIRFASLPEGLAKKIIRIKSLPTTREAS